MAHVLLMDPYFGPEFLARLLGDGLKLRTGSPLNAGRGAVAVVTAEQPVGQAELQHLPDMRVLVTASAGYEHLDLDALRARQVVVCHVPDYCTEEVADHALACVLSLLRGLPRFERAVQQGKWDAEASGPLRRLPGTRLGIVGLGRIGSRLAAQGLALGMEVLAFQPGRPAESIARLGVRPVSLEQLLASADAVSLHAPAQPGGAPILGERELALMRPGSVLVNTARASLVDLDALAAALRWGTPGSAYFDVWSPEPPLWTDPRLKSPNLFLSPHAAWASAQAEAQLWQGTAAAILAVLDGRPPAHRLV